MAMLVACPICDKEHRYIPPDGPESSPYCFVGEAGGTDEDKTLHPFSGKTGKEVNQHYLPLAGLRRGAVRFCNTIPFLPCTPGHKLSLDQPKHRELLRYGAEQFLYPELRSNHYSLLIPLGAFACHALDPDINLELQHGIPTATSWGTVFPMYHPAGGLHEPKKMLLIRTDWDRLRRYIRGTLAIPVDEYPSPDYAEVTDPSELGTLYLDPDQPLACDTESTRLREPFCLTYSNQPGTGRLIRADRKDLLEAFQDMIDRWKAPIIWHNWLYDYTVTQRMGLRFPHSRIVDTMLRAFHLGNVPQGLKALAYRECGMQMQDFDDLVTPYAVPKVLQYYREAFNEDWPRPEESMVRDKEGKWKMYRPQSMNTKLKRFFTDLDKNPNKDVFEAWDNWESSHPMIEERLGGWPGRCITYVPFKKALHYAVRDADATLRVYHVLDRMRHRVRKTAQERWRDVA